MIPRRETTGDLIVDTGKPLFVERRSKRLGNRRGEIQWPHLLYLLFTAAPDTPPMAGLLVERVDE
jgi:hypothetical protein